MAVAVSYREFKPANSRDDLIRRIEAAPATHAEAVLAAYALLEQLHDKGLLELATGLLSAGNTIIERLVDVVSAKESIDALRVIASLAKLFGKIDVDALLKALEDAPDAPPSYWRIGKQLNTRDARRALAAGARVLNIAGAALNSAAKTGLQSEG